jgi:NTP pyrophosphatase (non-canonical NTP hydrolase)
MTVHTIPLDGGSQRLPLGRGEFEFVWQQTERLVAALRAHFPANGPDRYVMGVAEEAGEFVGAYLRWAGQSRRTGTREEMAEELADVVVTAFAAAQVIGIDLHAAAVAKARKMLTRGFKEPRGPDSR